MTLDRAASMSVRSHLRFREKSALKPEGDRPVVGERNLHMGAENAGFDPWVPGPRGPDQSVEQFSALRRSSSGRESGPQALVSIRGQGELRHQQQSALDLKQAQIHLSGLVLEYPVLKEPIEQPQGVRFVVGGAPPHQHHEPRSYGGNALAVDLDAGLRDALQQSDHAAFTMEYSDRVLAPPGGFGGRGACRLRPGTQRPKAGGDVRRQPLMDAVEVRRPAQAAG